MPEQSPLSYQTTMPEYPDVSYQRYIDANGIEGKTRLGQSLNAWWRGLSDYSTWRTNVLDDYNAKMSAYNTWLQTGEGQRASLESGGYNSSYFQGQNASASPLNYQDVAPSSGFNEMAQGLQGVFSFVKAIQDMRLMGWQIANLAGKSLEQNIKNRYLSDNLLYRNKGLQYKSDLFGYNADYAQMRNEAYLYPIYQDQPWAFNGVFSPYGRGTYDLRRANYGFHYNRAYQDIEAIKAAVHLREEQKKLIHLQGKERQYYVDSIQTVYKDFLENQLALVKGQVSWQPTEQKLREKATNWGIGLNTANTVIGAARTLATILTRVPGPVAPSAPSWGNMPGQSQSWSGGWDVDTGELYGPWLNN